MHLSWFAVKHEQKYTQKKQKIKIQSEIPVLLLEEHFNRVHGSWLDLRQYDLRQQHLEGLLKRILNIPSNNWTIFLL